MKTTLIQCVLAAGLAGLMLLAADVGCGKTPGGIGGRCPAPNYTYCCAVQWNPPGTKFPEGTLTEMWKVITPNGVSAEAAVRAAIVALGGSIDMRPGNGAVTCFRSPGGVGCPNPARTLGPTSEGPTVQSYVDPRLKIVQSYAQAKLAAASGLPRPFGLTCNDCADNAANGTCASQVSACDADPVCSDPDPAVASKCCASCITCLYGGGGPDACGCDLTDPTVLNLGNCLLSQCPQCGGSQGTGGSATSTLLPDGATCSSDDDCQSCVCDSDNSTCITP